MIARVKADDVRRLYDERYAASYDRKFLETDPIDADTRHQLELVGSLLRPGDRWLDAACGTGYFLARFPDVERAGFDVSPAMIALARGRNPGVDLRLHDLRDPLPEWRERFGLVSCMWYAYSLVDTLDEIAQVLANFADWTAPDGRWFIPLADPDLIAGVAIPDGFPWVFSGGEMRINGIVWSFVEDEEGETKRHRHLVSPSIAWMREEAGRHFETIEIVHFPQVAEMAPRPALVASGRRPRRPG